MISRASTYGNVAHISPKSQWRWLEVAICATKLIVKTLLHLHCLVREYSVFAPSGTIALSLSKWRWSPCLRVGRCSREPCLREKRSLRLRANG